MSRPDQVGKLSKKTGLSCKVKEAIALVGMGRQEKNWLREIMNGKRETGEKTFWFRLIRDQGKGRKPDPINNSIQ